MLFCWSRRQSTFILIARVSNSGGDGWSQRSPVKNGIEVRLKDPVLVGQQPNCVVLSFHNEKEKTLYTRSNTTDSRSSACDGGAYSSPSYGGVQGALTEYSEESSSHL